MSGDQVGCGAVKGCRGSHYSHLLTLLSGRVERVRTYGRDYGRVKAERIVASTTEYVEDQPSRLREILPMPLPWVSWELRCWLDVLSDGSASGWICVDPAPIVFARLE